MKNAPHENHSTIQWFVLSLLLLALYLAFFHTVLGQSPTYILITGLVFSVLMTAIVVACRRVFLTKFEYWIHLVIGLDVFCEGFIPYHETLSFYYCALAFWTIFVGYHLSLLRQEKFKSNPEFSSQIQAQSVSE